MQTARLLKNIYARTEIQMIGVAQNYLSLDIITQLMLMHRFHATERTHRHKYGSLDNAMVGSDKSGTRIAAGCGGL